MGINKLLPEFPGGPMTSAKAGFDLLNPLLQGDETTDVDMGTLVYVCALKHKNTYNGGNYPCFTGVSSTFNYPYYPSWMEDELYL